MRGLQQFRLRHPRLFVVWAQVLERSVATEAHAQLPHRAAQGPLETEGAGRPHPAHKGGCAVRLPAPHAFPSLRAGLRKP
eukprot:13407573-Alexandrium_andersonii.AAC.1